MLSKTLKQKFKPGKEELSKLGMEFYSEAIPLLDNLHRTTYWILIDNRQSEKLIKKIFYEAIENCYITKNSADWESWIYRIWIREILEFYSEKENDTKTTFDFIDLAEINLKDIEDIFSSSRFNDPLNIWLKKLPAVLRIPLIMNEVLAMNYKRISELIDIPEGVIATRIYRARKLLFLFLIDDFDYNDIKEKFLPNVTTKPIFILRNFASLADSELSESEQKELNESTRCNVAYEAEKLLQIKVKIALTHLAGYKEAISKISSKIKGKAKKQFSTV
jgi:DNA-directed RNA polymerase specialized sigma24 family protein